MATQDTSLFGSPGGQDTDGPVECLGACFANDHERRTHFTALLRMKLQDPAFRSIEGFPIGEDEDILALSDPPYYTACPNPWLADFVAHYGKPYDSESDDYEREPFAADVSEGKNDPIYNAHSYHTKVPHKAIMRYILHYTEPGDVVSDGFCGTGMTGVAAQLCGEKMAVESLGYAVTGGGDVLDQHGRPISKLGPRFAILDDLSPAATYIARNYNTPADPEAFRRRAEAVLEEVERECDWMYLTLDSPTQDQIREAIALLEDPSPHMRHVARHLPWGRINYTIWSDIFICPECGAEIVFWDAAVDQVEGRIADRFCCSSCGAAVTKRSASRASTTVLDPLAQTVERLAKRAISLIRYSRGGERKQKMPDAFDRRLAELVPFTTHSASIPTDEIPNGYNTAQPKRSHGLSRVHQFYTWRTVTTLAAFRDHGLGTWLPFSALTPRATIMCRIAASRIGGKKAGEGGATVGIVPGTLFVPSISAEMNPLLQARERVAAVSRGLQATVGAVIETASSARIDCLHDYVDYIFTDPPFGGNLMYSELNFLWEAWLGVFTNNASEAIANSVQGKGLLEYQELMGKCFARFFSALKAGRWMTMVFHNSHNSVWLAIQEALQAAGFVVADVRTLDKQQGSFKQVTSKGAVKQDLVISAYKPRAEVEREFGLTAGSSDGAWAFTRGHLQQLPVSVEQEAILEIVAERQAYLLYDRMVAFHVLRGVKIPLSAAEFYAGLDQRFPCRDGMYFLPEQVTEYDKKRLDAQEVRQLELFVTDEESAIQWLRQALSDRPVSFQDIHPLFMREIAGWEKHERALELAELLEENFITYDGKGEVPSQIHGYLSSNFREMRGLEKTDAMLRAKAKDRWYVPDPRKAGDLEQLRERTLLKEFDDYASGRGKLKVFRVEAVRAGFKRGWQEHDYPTIISVAERLPADVLQEDAKLLMWYDQALTRAGE